MADPQAPPQAGGSFLKRKIGPLPVWAYLAALAGVGGYVWWERRQAANASSTSGADSGTDATADSGAVPVTDYGQGYDYGYLAGQSATGDGTTSSTTGTTTGTNPSEAVSHSRITAKVKDPSGRLVTVTGYGNWIKGAGGQWTWVQGMPSNTAASASNAQPQSTGLNASNQPLNSNVSQPMTNGSSGQVPTGQQVSYPMA